MENTEKNMEEGILTETLLQSQKNQTPTWNVLAEEVKRQSFIAAPMVAVILSTFLLNVISMMMVGHLGELALASSAIAVSICAVTGFSLLSGMASALETLCGQAFGARQYRKLGNQTYAAIFSLILVAAIVSILWINMGKLLVLIGQDPLIASEAGRFATLLVPALFAYAVFQPMIRFFQTQSLITPMLVCCFATLILHIPLCWVLVYKSDLRNLGGAVAISISNWLNVIFLSIYMKFSPACAKTRVPISMELFHGIGEFFRFAIPSAVMVCLQWWSYEITVLLSGLLSNPQLETSVLSACLTTISTLYSIPNGLSAAVSTRVSNELGAGNPQAAKTSVYAIMFITIPELLIVSGTLLATRHVFGYTFSSESEVIAYVDTMAPLVCLSVIVDGLQGVLSGVARGCGWQHKGAYINLGCLYLCGIPAAATLGFWLEFKARGLWLGNQMGAILQTIVLSLVIIYTNWDNQAKIARERMFRGRSAVPIVS